MNKQSKRKVILFSTIVCCILGIFGVKSMDDTFSAQAATKKGTVTADSLNVRTGPSYLTAQVMNNNRAVYLMKGDTVKVQAEESGYYKVKFTYQNSTITGYCNKAYIQTNGDVVVATQTPTKAPVENAVTIKEDVVPNAAVSVSGISKTIKGLKIAGKVTASSLRVRSKASLTAEQVMVGTKTVSLVKNQSVTILREKLVKGVVWYYVSFKYQGATTKGFVHSDYVTLKFNDTVKGKILTKSLVSVRNTAGVSEDYLMADEEIVTLANKKAVTVKKETVANGKKWFKISFKLDGTTMKGYILANQVEFKPVPVEEPEEVEDKAEEDTSVVTDAAITASVAPTVTETPQPATPAVSLGVVATGPLNVRVAAGMDQSVLTVGEKKITLAQGQTVSILETITSGGISWYRVSFKSQDGDLTGYVMAQYVSISSAG